MQKPRLAAWQIWNMSFGFLGIQFGWGLQMANMSAIYEYLKARPEQIPLLWLAAPLTGLIVQPIIGHMSDRTWGRLGRRRPYFLTGAILSTLALILMPNCSALWMAAGLLWILDASINISMEPFRAFVADLLPVDQRTAGFAMQSFFIGVGAVVASAMPWIMTNWLHVPRGVGNAIPLSVRYSFYIGAAAFFFCVLWTIVTTKEYPPADLEEFRRANAASPGIFHGAREIGEAILQMPRTMQRLALVQFATWMGLFCMWLYFAPAVAHAVFKAPDANSPLYQQGAEWASLCFSMYSLVAFMVAFLLPVMARAIGKRGTHALCLLCGAAGLLSVGVIRQPWILLLSMVGVGIAWASTVSMPYVILSNAVPAERTGVYMGIFNFFITLPEICASVGLGWVLSHWLGGNSLKVVLLGGVCLIVAAILMRQVPPEEAAVVREPEGQTAG